MHGVVTKRVDEPRGRMEILEYTEGTEVKDRVYVCKIQ